METKKRSLSQKLLALSFMLLILDLILYKFFGEPLEKYHSFGWYLFLVTTIFCSLYFATFLIALGCEFVSASKKKRKEPTMTKREKILKRFDKIEKAGILSAVFLLILTLSLCVGFKVDPIEDSFKLSNLKEITVFICEVLTGLSVLVAFVAPWVKYCWFRQKKMMNEP